MCELRQTFNPNVGAVCRMRRAVTRCVLLALLMTLLSGCYSPLQSSVEEQKLLADGKHELINGLIVPEVRGEAGCGAQALATAMAAADPNLDPAVAAEELPWHDEGATPADLLIEARNRGFEAAVSRGTWDELAANVRAGRASVVMVDASFQMQSIFVHAKLPEVMHWMVVSGVATDGSQVLLAAPGHRHHPVERDEFMTRWARTDYCLILVSGPQPPGNQESPANQQN
jgi:predicted double-glycine peptidase